MTISFELARRAPDDIDLLAVPVCSDDDRAADSPLDWEYLDQRGFEGKLGHVQSLPGDLGIQVLAVGLGPSTSVTPGVMRRAGAVLARASKRQRSVAVSFLDALGEDADRAACARALVVGMRLASYRYQVFKSDPEAQILERVTVIGTGGKRLQASLDLGVRIAEGVVLARDLVNEPGGSLTARRLAQVAVELAEREDLGASVMEEKDIEEAGLGGLLGVNRGSDEPPRLIELCYEPPGRARGTVALVGKGITFDSGGLSIKTSEGMMTMKDDMGGAAAILGAMAAIRAVKPPVRVRAYIPSTDNMTGGDATRPGDVLKIRNGKTVEVLNTDAEGRLVLADALSLASEGEPDAIIDVATLTGAVTVALGNRIAGLMGNNVSWMGQVKAASIRTGERAWELPLPQDYRRQLDSEVADLRNIGAGRTGGSLVAGLFLQEFVGDDIPWVHIDIAGTAWSESVDGIVVKGGTGYGVRLLLDVLKHYKKPH